MSDIKIIRVVETPVQVVTTNFVPINSANVASASFAGTANVAHTATSASFAELAAEATAVAWSAVTGKPDGLVSSSAQIDFSGISNKPLIISSSAQVTFAGISGVPSGLVSSSNQNVLDGRYYTESEVDSLLSEKSDTSHTHDDRNFTEAEVTSLLSAKSDTGHTHTFASITSKPAGLVSSSAQIDYNSIQNQPTSITSASYALTASYAMNGAGEPEPADWDSLMNKPVGLLSSSVVTIDDTGKLEWDGDTSLRRTTSGTLSTPGRIHAGETITSDGVIEVWNPHPESSSFATTAIPSVAKNFIIRGDGMLRWGDGQSSTDTNLYRHAADQLKTDDNFIAAGFLSGSTLNINGLARLQGEVTASAGIRTTSLTATSFVTASGGIRTTTLEAVSGMTTNTITATGGTLTLNGDVVVNGTFAAPVGGAVAWTNITEKPSGLVSSSAQINMSQVTTGTLSDARLSNNVALKDLNNRFSVPQYCIRPTGSNYGYATLLGDDVGPRWVARGSGELSWGAGDDTFDISLNRASGGTGILNMTTGNGLNVPSLQIGGTEVISGSRALKNVTVPDSVLSSNIPKLNATNIWDGWQTFTEASSTSACMGFKANDDASYRMTINAAGGHAWGDGTGGNDVRLDRISAGKLQVSGALDVTGDVTAFATSDARLKTDLEPITDALSAVDSLTGYRFTWTEDAPKSGRDVGVLAQDVQTVLPEVVAVRGDGTMAVRYELLVPLLVNAIKELKTRVDELEQDR